MRRKRTPTTSRRTARGFTVIELIIVVAMIGIIATIAIPALRHHPQRAKEAVLKTNLATLRDVINQHYGDKGRYPPSLEALVEEGYLRTVPVDPMTKSSETWVLELEEFDEDEVPAETDVPEDAAPGVINVYSASEELSLDGESRYSDW